MKEQIVSGVIVAALAAAFFTKPSQADFEAHIAEKAVEAQAQALGEGKVLQWFQGAGLEMTRGGRFENGIFSSTYHVTYMGNPLYKCTGLFGIISCGDPQ